MVINYIWQSANPELRGPLRAANEARAAAYYTVWRALTAPLRALVQALDRARSAGETFRALNRLSDHQLQDIGISRSEIGSVANAVAAKQLETGVTLAELREDESVSSASSGVAATPRLQAARGPETPVPQDAPSPCCRKAA